MTPDSNELLAHADDLDAQKLGSRAAAVYTLRELAAAPQKPAPNAMREAICATPPEDLLRLADYIADKIGLPHNEELSQENFTAWLRAPPSDDVRSVLADDIKLIGTALSMGDHPGGVSQAFYRVSAALRSAPVSAPAGLTINARKIAKDASERAGKNADVAPQLLYAPIQWAIQEAIGCAPAVGVTREAYARAAYNADPDLQTWRTPKEPNLSWDEVVAMGEGHATPFYNIADAILALSPVPDATVSEPKRWYLGAQNDGLFIVNAEPRPSNDYPWHDNPNGPTIALNVTELRQDKAQKIVDVMNALSPSPQDVDREATVSEFKNELGNTIRITIEGPTSKSTNDLTPTETEKLNEALTRHFAATVSARDAVIEGALEYEFPYQRTFDAIVASTDVLSGPPDQKMLSVSIRKFQETFNRHRDQRAIRSLASGAKP